MAKTTPAQRERIVNMITDSYIAHPKQSNAFIRSETLRIAKRVFGRDKGHDRLISVAAVRANYTMGRYGNPTELQKQRKKDLKKAVKS